MLAVIAGYGYRPLRCVLAYSVVVCGFALVYTLEASRLSFGNALLASVFSFHGRGLGFSSSIAGLTGVRAASAAEAVTGLLLEITFIATLTQRIFR